MRRGSDCFHNLEAVLHLVLAALVTLARQRNVVATRVGLGGVTGAPACATHGRENTPHEPREAHSEVVALGANLADRPQQRREPKQPGGPAIGIRVELMHAAHPRHAAEDRRRVGQGEHVDSGVRERHRQRLDGRDRKDRVAQ